MSASTKSWSLEDFLAWEETQEFRYEWDGEQAVAMVGGSLPHSAIKVNLIIELGTRLRGSRCRLFDSDAKVIVDGHARYPDATITRTSQDDPVGERRGVIAEPVVVFEVLSPGTQTVDRTEKHREYRATASILRYVMIESERMFATVVIRHGDMWVTELLFGPDAMLRIPEADIEGIAMADLYRDVPIEVAG